MPLGKRFFSDTAGVRTIFFSLSVMEGKKKKKKKQAFKIEKEKRSCELSGRTNVELLTRVTDGEMHAVNNMVSSHTCREGGEGTRTNKKVKKRK